MVFGLSDMLARQGLSAPSPASVAIPHGAQPVPVTGPGAPDPPPGAGAGMTNKDMLAMMQAFGGLKMPAQPIIDTPRAPQPVAPQGANATAIANTANTSAIASLLAAGLRPQPIPALGQMILGGR